MMRSLCGYGSGRSITASTTLKIAVVAPMPSASVRTTTVVKPGFLRTERAAYRRSCQIAVDHRSPSSTEDDGFRRGTFDVSELTRQKVELGNRVAGRVHIGRSRRAQLVVPILQVL